MESGGGGRGTESDSAVKGSENLLQKERVNYIKRTRKEVMRSGR